MVESFVKYGTLTRSLQGTEAHIVRTFPHDVDTVWRALTEPSMLAQWLAPGTIELRKGGTAKLDFGDSGVVIDSTVSAIDAPTLIEYSWSGPKEPLRPLRFTLEPCDEGCTLTLSLAVPPGEDGPRAAAGFEAHLEMLAAALEGVPIKFPFQLFKDMRAAYAG